MQQSWRQDPDKLTFIICLPLSSSSTTLSLLPNPSQSSSPNKIQAGEHDSPSKMLGDINLFLSSSEDSSDEDNDVKRKTQTIVGELEIMIAPISHRRNGYGRSALLTFLHYISLHLPEIFSEYTPTNWSGSPIPTPAHLTEGEKKLELRVKIGQENEKSLALFESLGFKKTTEEVSYFGEWELKLGDEMGMGWIVEGVGEGYEELEYVEVEENPL
jgi:hypothetical protein